MYKLKLICGVICIRAFETIFTKQKISLRNAGRTISVSYTDIFLYYITILVQSLNNFYLLVLKIFHIISCIKDGFCIAT